MYSDEIVNLATEVLELSRSNGHQIATAESCTGGLIIGALTEIAGSSDVVDRGFITYSNLAKQQSLLVNPVTLDTFGAVSEETAIEMAVGALSESEASIAVSVTGIAGPDGGDADKSVGLVHMAAQKWGNLPIHEKYNFGNIGRSRVREATIVAALNLLKKTI
jgi:nicotinamide-nucleotide amidase